MSSLRGGRQHDPEDKPARRMSVMQEGEGSMTSMVEPRAELFAHSADIGVRGIGPTPASAFEQAALALTMAITDPAEIAPKEAVEITCEAPDQRFLLHDWLNAVIYEMAMRHLVFGRFAVTIEGRRLRGRAWGEPVDRVRHMPAVEPKGATLTALTVEQRGDGAWVAECIVDV
jgi:SHS2 domain-containing protein